MIQPEVDLLLHCAGFCVGGVDAKAVRTRAEKPLDWAALIEHARQHGVTLLLFRALESACPDVIPIQEFQKLRQNFQMTANGNLFLTGELLKLLRLLRSNRIAAVPFKGPILSILLFGDVTFREFGDLDILVPMSDVIAARDLLLSNGYAAKHLSEKFDLYTQFGHELDLLRHDGNVAVDLQWRFASKWIAFPIDLDDFWKRLESRPIGGEFVLQPALDDLLLLLCGHGYRHLWAQLKWIVDVAAYVNRFGETIPWCEALEQAAQLGGRRIVLLGLHLARELLGTALPQEVRNAIDCDPKIGELGLIVRNQIIGKPQTTENFRRSRQFVTKLRFHFKARERWQDKLPNPFPFGQCVFYWGQRYFRHYSRQLSAFAGVRH